MIYAPRALRHFSLAAMESRALRTAEPRRPVAPTQPLTRFQPQLQPRRFVLRLWLPLTPIFLLLAPLAILLIPFCYLAPPLRGMNCVAAVFAIGRTLLSLGGTEIHIDTRDALLRFRIF
jgi:hypothetical protein